MESSERRLYRQMKQTCETYGLFAPGDHVMVAVSGGKDSYTLLDLLKKLAARVPFELRLVAVHLDQKQPGYDGSGLRRHLAESGVPFEIIEEDTYSIVTSHIEAHKTYCSLCSRLRRGVLYDAAERLGCNKIALGHHRDDALETFLMNLFFSGRLQAMPAKYTTDDGRFEVLRPLVECPETVIAEFARERAYPIVPCNLCGSQSGLQRDAMTALLDDLERRHPDVRSVMLNALRNVSPTHLLDPDLIEPFRGKKPASTTPAPDQSNPLLILRRMR